MPGLTHLAGTQDRRFPCFAPSATPCPTSTFRSFVKQIKPGDLAANERNFLNAAFAGFLTGSRPPGDIYALLASISPHAYHEDRLPRRYDGDRTLPRGRYSTVCTGRDGDDCGTLMRELTFYKNARVAEAHIEVYDPVVTEQREMIGRLGMETSARERIVVNVVPFAQSPGCITPLSVHLSLTVEVREVSVDNVLDLRRPTALDWLFRTIPKLHIILNPRGETGRCFPNRRELATFAELLPSLIDQQRGGGNFDKLVGLYLRQIGVSGLVFPSARSDASTGAVGGERDHFHGWSFVDYRDSLPQEIVAFVELRPEWPRTLTLEGGDDNEPRPAAFSNEFQILMTENFPCDDGGFMFRGIEQRMKAYHMTDSLEAAVRFRLADVTDEQVMQLKVFATSLGSRDCANFSAMVLYTLLGLPQARRDLQAALDGQLREHEIASLLARCVDPPPADQERLTRSGAFYSMFQAR